MKKGFTLIESLVVIAIIAILSVLVFPYYHSAREQLALQRSANKLAQDIRRVQGMALAAEEHSACLGRDGYKYGYGVFFKKTEPADQYTLFADCNGDGNYSIGEDEIVGGGPIKFEEGVEISGASSDFLRITFIPPDPTVTIIPGSVSPAVITITNNSQTKTIKVNKAGLIYVE